MSAAHWTQVCICVSMGCVALLGIVHTVAEVLARLEAKRKAAA